MSTVPGRSNGLTAASYVALVDLAPPLADALLDTLRVEAIAAYAAPATDRPLAELSARPPRPLDRVFVDRSASGRARAVLDAEIARSAEDHAEQADTAGRPDGTDRPERGAGSSDPAAPEPRVPGSTDRVDDDVWAGIVAALQGPSAVVDRPAPGAPTRGAEGPASFDILRDGERRQRAPGPAGDGADGNAADTSAADGDDGSGEDGSRRGDSAAEEGTASKAPTDPAPGPASGPLAASSPRRGPDDDHYQPPVPPPLPRLDPIGKAAWAGAAGAPILLVLGALAGVDLSGWLGLLLVLGFVAGFVTLVVRMKDSRDDGWDDGAVV